MFVTLYTDASADSAPKGERPTRFSYAFAATSSAGRIRRRGACPAHIGSINQAEFYGILAGIHRVRSRWPDAARILVVTDSQTAIAAIESDARSMPPRLRTAFRSETEGIRIVVQKVKAHAGRNTVRAYMNRLVDRHARKARDE